MPQGDTERSRWWKTAVRHLGGMTPEVWVQEYYGERTSREIAGDLAGATGYPITRDAIKSKARALGLSQPNPERRGRR